MARFAALKICERICRGAASGFDSRKVFSASSIARLLASPPRPDPATPSATAASEPLARRSSGVAARRKPTESSFCFRTGPVTETSANVISTGAYPTVPRGARDPISGNPPASYRGSNRDAKPLSHRRSPLAIDSIPFYPVGRMGDSLRVLIVDDEKNIRSTLAVCLHGLGCTTAEASSAEAALASLKREPFDVVFLD